MKPAELLTLPELAAALGNGTRTVTGWVATGCPHEKDARGRLRFDRERVLGWLRSVGRSGRAGRPTPGGLPFGATGLDLARANLRVKELEAEKRTRLEQEARGELLDSREVTEAWAAAGLAFKATLESLPARLSAELVGRSKKDTVRLLKAALAGALATLPTKAPGTR